MSSMLRRGDVTSRSTKTSGVKPASAIARSRQVADGRKLRRRCRSPSASGRRTSTYGPGRGTTAASRIFRASRKSKATRREQPARLGLSHAPGQRGAGPRSASGSCRRRPFDPPRAQIVQIPLHAATQVFCAIARVRSPRRGRPPRGLWRASHGSSEPSIAAACMAKVRVVALHRARRSLSPPSIVSVPATRSASMVLARGEHADPPPADAVEIVEVYGDAAAALELEQERRRTPRTRLRSRALPPPRAATRRHLPK